MAISRATRFRNREEAEALATVDSASLFFALGRVQSDAHAVTDSIVAEALKISALVMFDEHDVTDLIIAEALKISALTKFNNVVVVDDKTATYISGPVIHTKSLSDSLVMQDGPVL